MGFQGHILDGINRMKWNREMIKARRRKTARVRQMYTDSLKHHRDAVPDAVLPAEVLEQIKSDIRESLRRERRRTALLSSGAFLLLVCVTAVLFVISG